ncbi:MAG: [FeFe] hydrogenase H-cluster radical SAM maturase HydG, partial [Firmicutes bacterium]|nr:[FeFe] hydrogenase H-cluster radical SAM maturase HydG [Bacillota bacterium]
MIINQQQINECLTAAKEATAQQVLAILDKARAAQGLSLSETAILLHVTDPQLLAALYATAQEVKERIYGKRVVLFAPLYLSNECTNNCLYCAFRHSNQELERRTLTLDELREQVLILESMGHKRLLLESGEDLSKVPIDYVVQAIETIYATKSNHDAIRRVNVNVAATSVENYRALHDAGIGTYQLFQETYHRPTYEIMHPSGPKASYEYHLTAMERAMQAGIDDVGLGVLFGLYDHRFEVLALLQHAAYLEKTYGVGPHTISVPRLRLTGKEPIPQVHLVSDDDFVRMVAVLRLAVPYTGLILSTRERPELRDRLLDLVISQMSAASVTSPGGYKKNEDSKVSSQQFPTYDNRSLLE